jgi:hypothetical protein
MIRDELLERIRPAVEAFTAKLVELITARVEAQVTKVRAAAVKSLRAAMEDDVGEDTRPASKATRSPVPRRVRRRRARVRVRAQRNDARVANLPSARDRGKPATVIQAKAKPKTHACKACGQPGHNARTCGRQEPPTVDRAARASLLRGRVQARKSVAAALVPDVDEEDEDEPEVFADGFRPERLRDDEPPPAGLVSAALRDVGSEREVGHG